MDGLNAAITGAIADAREGGIVDEAVPGDIGDGEEVSGEADESTAIDTEAVVVDEAAKAVEEAVTTTTTTEAKTEEEKAAEKAAAEKLEEEVPAKDARGRENKIPYSRHVKITENAVKKAFAPIAAAFGGKPEDFKPEAVVARLTKATEMEGQLAADAGIKNLLNTNPDMFIHRLAQAHPGYRKFAAILDGGTPDKTQQKTTVVADAGAGEEPQPDIEFKDEKGNVTGTTYSLTGMKKRDAWRDAQLRTSILTELKPLRDAHDNAAAAAANEAAMAPVIQAQIQEAATWKDWAAVAKEVEAVLVADGTQAQQTGKYGHTLRSAYLQVMNARLEKAAGEATTKAETAAAEARKKAIEEMKKRPASTSAKTTDGKGEEGSGPRSLIDVIKGEVAKVKGVRT